MAGIAASDRVVLALTALAAIALPAWLLRPPTVPVDVDRDARPLSPPTAPPPLRAAFARPLFAPPPADAAPADAPQLLGVVGRLGRDAVALVRGAAGTRSLAPGDAIDGWQLRSLAIDAAYFTRGGQTARVAVPGGE
ncbi:hypothetical protein [Sphingomonas sp. CFBP 13720]|uniref:hypothetical protein n=1 Tax=Sphingomonas sp. CFBP 13720 TaxID=2775302 RepID=UPI00313A46F8